MLSRRALLGGALLAGAVRAGLRLPVAATTVAADDYDAGRDFYTRRALEAAFADGGAGWDPARGYAANRDRFVGVYDYYGALFLARPETYLWAGLARLGGAGVLGGLDALTRRPVPGYPDPSLLTRVFAEIARRIFLDLGWLHEAYGDDPARALALARGHDRRHPARESYGDAWAKIVSSRPVEVAAGNNVLFANEQFSVVQPRYDRVLADPEAGPAFVALARATRRVHPYHRDFAEAVPGGDLTDAGDRWRWIAGPGGMWEGWLAAPTEERVRLVSLPLEDLSAGRWGETLEEYVPEG